MLSITLSRSPVTVATRSVSAYQAPRLWLVSQAAEALLLLGERAKTQAEEVSGVGARGRAGGPGAKRHILISYFCQVLAQNPTQFKTKNLT